MFLIGALLAFASAVLLSGGPASVNAQYISWDTSDSAPYISFELILIVPPIPATSWEPLYIWPGMNGGFMQPVLGFGQSNTGDPYPDYKYIDYDTQWWISADVAGDSYVSTDGGYFSSRRMIPLPGDSLYIVFEQVTGSTKWTQTVTNMRNNETVSLTMDMHGIKMTDAVLCFELYGKWSQPPVSFTVKDIKLTANASDPGICQYAVNVDSNGHTTAFYNDNNYYYYTTGGWSEYPGANVVCSQPVINGATCTIATCIINGS